jgi:broad specificity phosphatase PhoE
MIITAKPFEQMTLTELRAEYLKWILATRPGAWGARYENAHIVRDTLATWIARREREAREVAA